MRKIGHLLDDVYTLETQTHEDGRSPNPDLVERDDVIEVLKKYQGCVLLTEAEQRSILDHVRPSLTTSDEADTIVAKIRRNLEIQAKLKEKRP